MKLPNLNNLTLRNQAKHSHGRDSSSALKQHLAPKHGGMQRLCGLCGGWHAPGAPHKTHRPTAFQRNAMASTFRRKGPIPERPIAYGIKKSSLEPGSRKVEVVRI